MRLGLRLALLMGAAVVSGGGGTLALTGSPVTTGVVDGAYATQLVATGGSGSYVYSINTIIPGLTFNTSTGLWSGEPLYQWAATGVVISVSDGVNTVNSASFSVTIGPNTVGGVQVGTTQVMPDGNTYELAWGDDFDRPLAENLVVGPAQPYGRYFPTKHYTKGVRGNVPRLAFSYDTDPFHTGFQNSNRGVALGYTGQTQAGSTLTLSQKLMTSAAQRYGASTVSAFLQSGTIMGSGAVWYDPGASASSQDIFIEYNGSFPVGAPGGIHPTAWDISMCPTEFQGDGGVGNGDELDWWENNSTVAYVTRHRWTAGSTSASLLASALTGVMDGVTRTWAVKENTSALALYKDGVAESGSPYGGSANSYSFPKAFVFSNHTYNFAFPVGGEEFSSISSWRGMGAADYPITLNWVRVWKRVGKTTFRPKAVVTPLSIASGAGGELVFPSQSTLWGATGLTEYVQVIPYDSEEQDVTQRATSPVATTYTQFPSGFSWDSTNRKIVVTTGVTAPGRYHVVMGLTGQPGCVIEPVRAYIDVGPTVGTIPGKTLSIGQVVDIDCYWYAKAGCLVSDAAGANALTFALTGTLPPGLSFSNTTFRITGTVGGAATGSYNWGLTVTNSSGQSASGGSGVITIAAQSAVDKVDWTGWYDASDAAYREVSGSDVLRILNKAKWGTESNLQVEMTPTTSTSPGTGTMAVSAAAKNGLDIIAIGRATSGPPRAMANRGDAVSRLMQGSAMGFTMIIACTPRDTNASMLAGWYNTITTVSSEQIQLNRRNGSGGSSTRFETTDAAGNNSTTTPGGVASSWDTLAQKVVVLTFDGADTCVWWNNGTKTGPNTRTSRTFSDELLFMLFAQMGDATNSGSSRWDPSFSAASGNTDFYECRVKAYEASDLTNAATWISELQAKWAIAAS